MHKSPYVVLGCTDCHGGDATQGREGRRSSTASCPATSGRVTPSIGAPPPTRRIPARSSTTKTPQWIRFVNPGDLRVAEQACGLCHENSLEHVANSMMTTGQMLWGAALYNNGGYWKKNYVFGQSYGRDGAPLRVNNPFRRHAGDDPHARHPALPAAAAALQPQPARQHAARL